MRHDIAINASISSHQKDPGSSATDRELTALTEPKSPFRSSQAPSSEWCF